MASLTDWDHRCLGCGGTIADVLWRLGSVRCHECRDRQRPVNPAIVAEWSEAQRVAAVKKAERARRHAEADQRV
jgi:hypothetical protein